MKDTNHLFLQVLRAALTGQTSVFEELTSDQWREILQLGEVHKVLPMILDAGHRCPGIGNLEATELTMIRRQIRHQVMIQAMRTSEFLSLNRSLRDAGIKPLVVKGLICRQLYRKPDLRPSGDEDVLVRVDQFTQCCCIMKENGLEPGADEAGAYEVPFRKKGSPLYIELHKHLFPPESDAYGDLNRFFEGVHDRAVELKIEGDCVWTMAPTDHLFYLICHAFKHFLHSGFGIRQVCDICLFAIRYNSDIHWEQVLSNCEAIRAEYFAGAVFRIGENHLGIHSPAIFRNIEIDEMPLLSDLLEGGLYGDASLSRKHSSNITLEMVIAQNQRKRTRGAVLASVFPSTKKLAGRYPYLIEKPWLLPVAWGQRLWQYAKETRKAQDSKATEALKIGNERVKLLRYYGIIR